MTSGATILLTGATGQIGVYVLPKLVAKDYPVIALSRQAGCEPRRDTHKRSERVMWVHPDAILCNDRPSEKTFSLDEVEVLLSCGPIELAIGLIPRCLKLKRVICISTSSIYTKHESPVAAERNMIRRIMSDEVSLKDSCQPRNISVVLLRPTMIYGCGLDQNISRIAGLVRRWHFLPVAGKASGQRQPVHADDLALVMIKALESDQNSNLDTPVCGGSVITYREMVQRIFAAQGRTSRILPVPPSALVWLFRAISWLPFMAGLNVEYIRRQNRDMVFDDSILRKKLGFTPRPFEPTEQDFRIPENLRALQPWL